MADGERFERNAQKLEDSEDLKIIRKSRPKRGGGVAIVFNKNRITLKPVKIRNNAFKIVAALGRTANDATKFLAISAYYLSSPDEKGGG